MHRFSTRRLGRRAGLPIAAATLLAGLPLLIQATSAAVAAAAGASNRPAVASTPSISLGQDGATVKTSNGKSWTLTVAANNANVSLELARGSTSSEELHAWDFTEHTAGDFKFSPSTGVGTVKTGSATSPVATIDVTFRATGHKATTCMSGSETVYTGTLTGEAKLVTGLAGGGTVGGSGLNFNVSFDGSKPTVSVDNNCSVAFPCPTSTSYSFSVFPSVQAGILAEGINATLSHKAYDFVTISKGGVLSKPAGTETDAIGFVFVSPAKWTKATKTMAVTTASAGLITGSATLVGGKSSSFPVPCTLSGKKSSTTEIAYDANMSSPAGHALTAHMTIGAPVALPLSVKNSVSSVVNILILLGK